MKMQQEKEAERQKQQQRESSLERKKQQERMGGSVAQSFSPAHQGKTIQVRGRSPSVRILADIADTGAASSSQVRSQSASSADRVRLSGKQTVAGAGVILEPVVEGFVNFSTDKKMKGTKLVEIDNYDDYWTNQGMTKDKLKEQFTKHKMKYVEKSSIELIADLITNDRQRKNLDGIASVQDVRTGKQGPAKKVIQIIYPKK